MKKVIASVLGVLSLLSLALFLESGDLVSISNLSISLALLITTFSGLKPRSEVVSRGKELHPDVKVFEGESAGERTLLSGDAALLLRVIQDPSLNVETSFRRLALARLLAGVREGKIAAHSSDDSELNAEGVFLLAAKSQRLNYQDLLQEGLELASRSGDWEAGNLDELSTEVRKVLNQLLLEPALKPEILRLVSWPQNEASEWVLKIASTSSSEEVRRAVRLLSIPLKERIGLRLLTMVTQAPSSTYETFLTLLSDEEKESSLFKQGLTQVKIEYRFKQAEALS